MHPNNFNLLQCRSSGPAVVIQLSWVLQLGAVFRVAVARVLSRCCTCKISGVQCALHDASDSGADGQVRTISSTCTHRGAQLANGWIDTINGETCVRCPYHAWAYNGDGTVKDIPVQPEGGYPKRPLQQSFDTTIEDGKIWLFWGRPQIPVEERPPVPGSRADAIVSSYRTTGLYVC